MTVAVPDNPAGLVYGTIAVATLLAAESARRETFADTAGAVALTILIYWLARSYAGFAGERITSKRAFSLGGLAEVARQEAAVLSGGAVPLAIVLLFWVTGGSVDSAIKVAVWAAAIVVVLVEFGTGVQAGLRGRELAGQTVIGALLGLLVIALRILLH